jgi:hypothetical protein
LQAHCHCHRYFYFENRYLLYQQPGSLFSCKKLPTQTDWWPLWKKFSWKGYQDMELGNWIYWSWFKKGTAIPIIQYNWPEVQNCELFLILSIVARSALNGFAGVIEFSIKRLS